MTLAFALLVLALGGFCVVARFRSVNTKRTDALAKRLATKSRLGQSTRATMRAMHSVARSRDS